MTEQDKTNMDRFSNLKTKAYKAAAAKEVPTHAMDEEELFASLVNQGSKPAVAYKEDDSFIESMDTAPDAKKAGRKSMPRSLVKGLVTVSIVVPAAALLSTFVYLAASSSPTEVNPSLNTSVTNQWKPVYKEALTQVYPNGKPTIGSATVSVTEKNGQLMSTLGDKIRVDGLLKPPVSCANFCQVGEVENPSNKAVDKAYYVKDLLGMPTFNESSKWVKTPLGKGIGYTMEVLFTNAQPTTILVVPNGNGSGWFFTVPYNSGQLSTPEQDVANLAKLIRVGK